MLKLKIVNFKTEPISTSFYYVYFVHYGFKIFKF